MRIWISLCLIWCLFSCSSDQNDQSLLTFSDTEFPQTWEINQIIVGLSGEVLDKDELQSYERYTFMENGAFKKYIVNSQVASEVAGTFEKINNEDGQFLKLTFTEVVTVESGCIQDNIETLRISEDRVNLINQYCQAFDGPGLVYIRVD